jgi:glycosyltransferase involved in cell wall biosynthesis
MPETLSILALEAFYGGSHRDFLDGLIRHSAHDFSLLTLRDQFWKWRMRGSALHFLDAMRGMRPDLIVTGSMTSAADLQALMPLALGKRVPLVYYAHETQFDYPVSEGEKRDRGFGFLNLTSMLAADAVFFNSRTHLERFLDELPAFLTAMPDAPPLWTVDAIRRKAEVQHPGIDWETIRAISRKRPEGPPIVLWNHRWEHDKNPLEFFRALFRLDDEGIPFRLAILGENYVEGPPIFAEAKARFGDRILYWGYRESRAAYYEVLRSCDIVVSAARQENFGLSVVEAMAAGCHPILPRRLSYPELLPTSTHEAVLFPNHRGLVERLRQALLSPVEARLDLSAEMERFSWPRRALAFDQRLSEVYQKFAFLPSQGASSWHDGQ